MTPISKQQKSLLQFGPYRIDPAQRALFTEDRLIPLQPKVFDTLLALVENQGRILEKDEGLEQVWPDTFVEEGSLARNVSTLRKVLGETPDGKGYIETIPKRGYRFVAQVVQIPGATPEALDGDFEPQHHEDAKQRSIVVLPFQNLSGDADHEYFSDGLTEEITNVLASIRGLRVVARTTAFQFKGKNLDVRLIGSRVSAEAVLEGSVRRQGDRLRITAQLISTRDGYHHWSRVWDKELRDVFEVQQEIANRVALELSLDNRAADQPALPPTQNMEAYNLYPPMGL
jgi:TolB-like protein